MNRIFDTSLRTATTFVTDFKGFLLKHNFLSMAVGVVIGSAVNDMVKALVQDWITPLITVMGAGSAEFGWVWRLGGQAFYVGHFVGSLVNFLIIAFVVFITMRSMLRTPPPPPSKQCPFCLEAISPAARRCKYCTADQPALA